MPMRFGTMRPLALAMTLALACNHAAAREDFSARELQQAFYFFQTEQGAEAETRGTVEWSKVDRPVPGILATIRLPEKDVTIRLSIFPNSSDVWRATHMIRFTVSGELAKSPIRSFPAIAGKTRENFSGERLEARALPRLGVPWFRLALSDRNQQTELKNLQRLRYGAWFDVAIRFRDGSRALLTIERGEAGAEIFDSVLQAWQAI